MRYAAVLLVAITLPALPVAQVFAYDFEQSDDPATYDDLDVSKVESEIVDGPTGQCLQARNPAPGRYAVVSVRRPFALEKNLILSFDYRAECSDPKDAGYVACLFFEPDDTQYFGSDSFTDGWRHAEFALADLHSPNDGTLELGAQLSHVNLYARAKGEAEPRMTLWLDNIRLEARPREGRMTDTVRVSYATPPFFNWVRSARGRLEYSRDASFPAGQTTSVDADSNFHMPDEPLAPGKWYWRVYSEADLTEGWSDIEAIEIVPEAHQFTTDRVDGETLASADHPRVIPSLRQIDDEERKKLVAEARKAYETGIPDDPPPFAEGNPDWPTWIDWYGKVHGGITSRAGLRIQRMAEILALTGDDQVREWTREMALAVAAWDPEGGSRMGNGDIGAHHVLRGLNWCYDALHDDLDDTDRDTLRAVMIERAEQFWQALSPFRGSEANNHAWLKALACGETGLVLMGEHEDAYAWAECSRQLYLGLFLPVMGYQGENNEGLAYWNYGLGFIIRYGDMMKHACGIDLYQHPWLNQTARFPMYSAPPGAWAISFADTGKPNHGMKGPACQNYVRQLALRTRDPYALWYSGATEAVDGLEPKAPTDLPKSIHYRHIGWGLFHTDLVDGANSVSFGMRSGPFWAGHQHDDQNSFVINAYGEKLAIDSGYYDWYGSDHFTEYSSRTKAHNTILVNGENQAHFKRGADGNITEFFDSPQFGYIEGDASDPEIYDGKLKRFVRRVIFVKPHTFIIHDSLESAIGPVKFDWLLHAVAPFEKGAADGTWQTSSANAKMSCTFMHPKVGVTTTEGFPVEPVDGYSTRPVPPEKYVNEWTLSATPSEAREAEDFLTALHINRGSGVPGPWMLTEGEDWLGVHTPTPGYYLAAAFRRDNGDGIDGELVTDGDAIAFFERQFIVVNATGASAVGDELLRSTAPVTVAFTRVDKAPTLTASLEVAATVSARVWGKPNSLTLNGEPTDFRYANEMITLDLEAGEHVIEATMDEGR